MEKELGADIIKATQTSLGKYVKRPPLTEKLLRKPPFRFLHDIVSVVLKTTGFFEGLFDEEELISDNVKDRDRKLLFLNKVISVIGLTIGKPLSAKSSKIVAGQEPEKTNELLQCLASALDKKLSSDEAVKKYKDNLKAPVSSDTKPKEKDTAKSVKKSADTKKLNSKSSEKLTTKKELGTVNKNNITTNDPKTKKKDTNVTKNEIPPKKPQQLKIKKGAVTTSIETEPVTSMKEKQIVIEKETNIKENNKNENEEIAQSDMSIRTESKDNDYQNNSNTVKGFIVQSIAQESDGELNSSNATGVENELNLSLSSQDLMDIENADKATINTVETSAYDNKSDNFVNDKQENYFNKEYKTLPAKSIEPVLSRNVSTDSTDKNNELDKSKIIDKVVRKNSDIIRPPSVRPSSSRPGAPRLREKIDNVLSENDTSLLLAKVNIIAEYSNNEDEEEKSIIVVEQHIGDESTIVSQQDQMQLLSNEHGHLVQQILDSQKEFSQNGKTEIEWQFGAQKVKEAVNQEIEQLRFNIQALSRVANPLGKLLDHIQEDAEVMRQELQQWTNVYDEVFKEMQKQKMANEETLIPIQFRVKQLDADIQEKHDKIDDLKILIHKNTSRIEKLLINGNVQ